MLTAESTPFPTAPSRSDPADAWSAVDYVVVAVLVACAGAYVRPFLDSRWEIYEDAAMLLRYAQHVADRHGIVWNIGERPVDGATDVLFMWIIAGLHRWTAMPLETVARDVSAAAHLALVAAVYAGGRVCARGPRVLMAAAALWVAVGPGKAYIAGGFGTTMFALIVALAWCATLEVARRPTVGRAVIAGVLGILAGIARPEGGLLAAYSVAGLLAWRHDREMLRAIFVIAFVGGVVGAAYWLWRWHYFGYPLPNPFYRKGGGQIHFGNFLITSKYGALHLLPFLPALAVGLLDRETRRTTLLAAVPIVAFLASWMLLSNEMNFFHRFQYAVAPVAAIGWPTWIGSRPRGAIARWTATRGRRAMCVSLTTVAIAGLLAYQHRRFTPGFWRQDLREVGRRLAPYRDRGYVMAVSEAGLLPLYSQWRAVDTWGLNDQWIAHHSVVSEAYLDRYRPALVMFYAACAPATARSDNAWQAMTAVLDRYVTRRGYALVSVIPRSFGGGATLFYVRPDFGDAPNVAAAITDVLDPLRSAGRRFALEPCSW